MIKFHESKSRSSLSPTLIYRSHQSKQLEELLDLTSQQSKGQRGQTGNHAPKGQYADLATCDVVRDYLERRHEYEDGGIEPTAKCDEEELEHMTQR